MVDSDRFAEFASENLPSPRKPPRATEDSADDLEIVRHDDRASGNAPPPDENDDLQIVRNMVDEFALGGADLAGARPFIAPPPPRKIEPEPEAEPVAEVEPEEPLFSVNWDEELSTKRRPTPAGPPVAAAPPKRAPKRRPAPRPLEPIFIPTIVTAVAVLVGLAATVATSLSIEPFHTWYYLFAWYPFLLVVNLVTTANDRDRSILGRRGVQLLPLLAWSVPVWLFFEAWNFRLQDWYYVGVPHGFWARRIGVCLSFATVLPGLFLLEEAGRVRGAFEGLRSREFDVPPSLPQRLWIAGAAVAVLLLALPSVFFPLLWGVPLLAIEPWLWRRGGASLLRDLAEGRPGRVLRLLIAGLVCGLFWEAANFLAGGRWIYTVPGLDRLKWFEMPPLGFLGFAPFALCCWSMARGLVELGLLADWEHRRETVTTATTEDASPPDASSAVEPPTPSPVEPLAPRSLAPKAKLLAIVLTTLGSLLVLQGMDRWTVDSLRPRAEDVPGIPDGIAEFVRHRGRDDVVGLLHAIESGNLYVPGQSNERMLEDLERHARIVLLRGIGAKNAARLARVGIDSIDELAAADRDELVAALDAIHERGWKPRPRRVAVWIRGARHETNARAPDAQ